MLHLLRNEIRSVSAVFSRRDSPAHGKDTFAERLNRSLDIHVERVQGEYDVIRADAMHNLTNSGDLLVDDLFLRYL